MGENAGLHLLRQALGVGLACGLGQVHGLLRVRGGAVRVAGQPQRLGQAGVQGGLLGERIDLLGQG